MIPRYRLAAGVIISEIPPSLAILPRARPLLHILTAHLEHFPPTRNLSDHFRSSWGACQEMIMLATWSTARRSDPRTAASGLIPPQMRRDGAPVPCFHDRYHGCCVGGTTATTAAASVALSTRGYGCCYSHGHDFYGGGVPHHYHNDGCGYGRWLWRAASHTVAFAGAGAATTTKVVCGISCPIGPTALRREVRYPIYHDK